MVVIDIPGDTSLSGWQPWLRVEIEDGLVVYRAARSTSAMDSVMQLENYEVLLDARRLKVLRHRESLSNILIYVHRDML